MQEMTEISAKVSAEIEGIADVGQENSAAAQEVSAAATEMNGQIADIRASVISLQEMAHGLQTLVARFTLESTEGDATTESLVEINTDDAPTDTDQPLISAKRDPDDVTTDLVAEMVLEHESGLAEDNPVEPDLEAPQP